MIKLLVIIGFTLGAMLPAYGQDKEPQKDSSFSFYIDNDSRNIGGPNEDQGYTSGLRFSYVFAEKNAPPWLESLPWNSELQNQFRNSSANYGFSLAQQIYTPNNTESYDLIPNDRPYAGYLYLGLTASFKTPTHLNIFEVDFGIIGPEALGEQFQNGFHDTIGAGRANGWKNQLYTEPTLQLSFTQKLRFFEALAEDGSRYFDLIPQFGLNLGNVLIAGHTGAMARLGIRLPEDFGPANLSSSGAESLKDLYLKKENRWRLYAFAGIQGRAVAHNIFLDGNTFQPSHHVKKYPFVAESQIGYALQVDRVVYSWRFITLSPEFEQYSEVDSYASIALTYLSEF